MDYLTYRLTTHGIVFYTTNISVDLAHHEIFHAKVGKSGIKNNNLVSEFANKASLDQ